MHNTLQHGAHLTSLPTRRQLEMCRTGEVPLDRLHYHVRELERLGLVVLVETREKGGILEKYYRTRGRTLAVPSRLFQEQPPDETVAAISDFLQDVTQGFMQSLSEAATGDAVLSGAASLSRWHLWLTDDDVAALHREIAALIEPYEQPRDFEGERELTFVEMLYNPRVTGAADQGK